MLLVYDETLEAQAALKRCSQLSLALSAHVDVISVVDAITASATCAGMLSDLACRTALNEGFAQPGDKIVIAAGVPFGRAGTTNMLRLATVWASPPPPGTQT